MDLSQMGKLVCLTLLSGALAWLLLGGLMETEQPAELYPKEVLPRGNAL